MNIKIIVPSAGLKSYKAHDCVLGSTQYMIHKLLPQHSENSHYKLLNIRYSPISTLETFEISFTLKANKHNIFVYLFILYFNFLLGTLRLTGDK